MTLAHVFAVLPVVAMPILLALASTLLRARSPLYRYARLAQPFASLALLASLLVPTGTLAGVLALPWLALAVVLAIAGIPAAMRAPIARASLVAAHVFLPIGAVWLVLSRLGTGPSHFSALEVFLAATHFHFSGFALQLLLAASAQRVCTRLATAQRVLAIAGIVGIVLIAIGKLGTVAPAKLLGVTTMVVVTLGVALLSVSIARLAARGIPRALLFVAAGSIGSAMLLAAAFGFGNLVGSPVIGVDRMVTTHGLLNALGFVVCGAFAHFRLARSGSESPAELPTQSGTFRRGASTSAA